MQRVDQISVGVLALARFAIFLGALVSQMLGSQAQGRDFVGGLRGSRAGGFGDMVECCSVLTLNVGKTSFQVYRAPREVFGPGYSFLFVGFCFRQFGFDVGGLRGRFAQRTLRASN